MVLRCIGRLGPHCHVQSHHDLACLSTCLKCCSQLVRLSIMSSMVWKRETKRSANIACAAPWPISTGECKGERFGL